jgi:uncharacterized protein (TIRG00374 family)
VVKVKHERTLRRPAVRLAQALAFLFVVNTFVLPQLAGTREAISLIGDLDGGLLLIGSAAELASLVCVAHLIRTLMPEAVRPSLWTIQRIVIAARAASRVVPGGAAVGGVISYRLLRRVGVPTPEAGFSVGTQSIESAAMLIVLLFLALVVSVPVSGLSAAYLTVTIFGLIVLLALAGLVVGITRGEEQVVDSARRLAVFVRIVNPDFLEGALRTLAAQLSQLTGDRRELVRQAAWSAAYWLLGAAALWVFLGAYGSWGRVDGLIIAFALANIVATVPITPGGLGVMEVTLVASLVGFGTPPSIALLGVVSWRLINFWVPLPLGAVAYLSLAVGRTDDAGLDQIEALTEEARVQAREASPWRGAGRGSADPH